MQQLESKTDEELEAETRYKAAAQAILGYRAAERYDAKAARAHFQKALAAREERRSEPGSGKMADASLALAERRADDLKRATERLGVEAPTNRPAAEPQVHRAGRPAGQRRDPGAHPGHRDRDRAGRRDSGRSAFGIVYGIGADIRRDVGRPVDLLGLGPGGDRDRRAGVLWSPPAEARQGAARGADRLRIALTHAVCGRYTLATPNPAEVRGRFPIGESIEVRRRYNVAPGDEVLAVTTDKEGRSRGELLRWGLVPSWAKQPDTGLKMINARVETVGERPAYRRAFERYRCLIIADGFYEWRRQPAGPKQAFHIARADGGLFAFAGLWSIWHDDENEGRRCARARS